MGSLSIWHWLIVLLVIVLVFGTKKLGNIGADLGKAVKGFKVQFLRWAFSSMPEIPSRRASSFNTSCGVKSNCVSNTME